MSSAEFDLESGLDVLRRTPAILRAWLSDLPSEWAHADEGPETWSPFDVVGHLIHGERTDWMPRTRQILEGRGKDPFPPFDRFAQFQESRGKALTSLLQEFEELRAENLAELEEFGLSESDLGLSGTHPELGPVVLRQLLATWVVHDLSHLAQIARVMAKRYGSAVGPWKKYLSVLER